MGYTHLEPGQECEIVERVYSCDGNSDISTLVQLSPAELDELAQDSIIESAGGVRYGRKKRIKN